ncbi:MAG: Gfo/Idh/MocA family oxidoreductase [Chloroflexota bacterium]
MTGTAPSDRLTLGVIGAGTWALAAHLPAFANRADVAPLIINRRDPARLAAAQARFGFARATTDWREVIDARPDLVVLTGPVGPRAEQARAALEMGAHVLAEKPFTRDPADAWALARLAEERGRTLMICYGWNEMGIVEAARRLLREDGGIGTIEHVTAVMASGVRDLLTAGDAYPGSAEESPPRLETWGDPQVSGGGYGQGQLTHGLGILFRLLDGRATDVMAFTNHPGGTAVELYDAIALRLEGGVTGTVSGAALPPRVHGYHHQMQVTVSGSIGQLQLDMDRPLLRRSTADGTDTIAAIPEEDLTWSFQRVVDRFVSLAKGEPGVENRSDGALGARVVEVLDAMARSAESGRKVEIVGG